MAVDTALYPSALNTTLPTASDFVSEGDDNLRQIKTCLKTTFPNFGGAFNATQTEANYLVGVTSAIQTQLNDKAPKDSPVITTAATLPAATTIGTVTAAEILRLSGVTSPIQTQLTAKANWAGQTYSGAHDFTAGSISVPTVTAGDSSTNAASTAFVAGVAFAAALPGQSAATADMFPKSNGSTAAWAYPYLTRVTVTGTTQAAVTGKRYELQNGAATTVTLPLAPADGYVVAVLAVNLLTTNVIARNGQLVCGVAEDLTIDNPYYPVVIEFRTGYGWGLVA